MMQCHSLLKSKIFQDSFLSQKTEIFSNCFLDDVFFHMTHMYTFYLPPMFYNKYSVASWSKSPKMCNVENYPKL